MQLANKSKKCCFFNGEVQRANLYLNALQIIFSLSSRRASSLLAKDLTEFLLDSSSLSSAESDRCNCLHPYEFQLQLVSTVLSSDEKYDPKFVVSFCTDLVEPEVPSSVLNQVFDLHKCMVFLKYPQATLCFNL